MNAFFKQKKNLLEFTPPLPEKSQNDRKVILLLFDALREDFVALPDDVEPYLKVDRPSAYKGRKIQMFKEARETHPENSLLFPLTSEMPTVTTVRIKGMLSGGITNFFETSEEFGSSEVKEDNVLHQLRNRNGKRDDIVFYGDYIWSPMFGKYFDRHREYESLNVRDLDTLDNNVSKDIYKELEDGSKFSLMLAHIIGVDSAGHTYNAQHPEVERKIIDSEDILHNIIEKMDDQTTLIVFGDHGMTSDGNHGGSAEDEMRSVLFAYQKTPFAQHENFKNLMADFKDMNRSIKQVDLAAIVSVILDLSFPFSNLGVFHPAFYPSENLDTMHKDFMKNLNQFETYLKAYCKATKQPWCDGEISQFAEAMANFRKFNVKHAGEQELTKSIKEMHKFANERYSKFSQIWTEFNQFSFFIGIAINVWLVIFHCTVAFSHGVEDPVEADSSMLIGIFGAIGVYVASIMGYVPAEAAAVAAILVTFLQSTMKFSSQTITWLKVVTAAENLNPKSMLYFVLTLFVIILFIVQQFVDSMIQECDYVTDGFVMMILAFLWLTKPGHLRKKDYWAYFMIIVCIKVSYFVDRERSMNFEVESTLSQLRSWFQSEVHVITLVPLALLIPLEWKVMKKQDLGYFHFILCAGLTSVIFAWQIDVNRIPVGENKPQAKLQTQIDLMAQHQNHLAVFGTWIYLAVLTCVCLSIVKAMVLGTKKEQLSIEIGMFILKAAIVVAGKTGPMVYFCLLLQLYCFAGIIARRHDSRPGATFSLQMLFMFFTMQQYFYRSNHRHRFSAVQFGKVCPGGVFCGEILHWVLIIFELAAAMIIGYCLMPMVACARIRYVYQENSKKAIAAKKDDETDSPAKIDKKSTVVNRKGKGKKVAAEAAIVPLEIEEKKEKEVPQTFRGTMDDGMKFMQIIGFIMLACSAIFVQMTQQEIIFPQRSAPKYVFDFFQIIYMTLVACYWA